MCLVEVLLESPGSLAGHDPVLLQLLKNRVHLTLSQSTHNKRGRGVHGSNKLRSTPVLTVHHIEEKQQSVLVLS